MKKCVSCGKVYDENEKCCPNCGCTSYIDIICSKRLEQLSIVLHVAQK